MALHKLVFDTTSTATQNDSANVGAYVRASDGSLIAATSNALHVSQQGTVTVTATDFDIRDLSAAQDNVAISDGTDTLAINTDGSIGVRVSDGTDSLEINADGSINAVVSATDLDIRDLTHVSDSVRLGNGSAFISTVDGASDDIATGFVALSTGAFNYGFDGTNWDRLRSTSGALHVDIQDASITVSDVALANVALKAVAETVGTSAAAIVDGADELSARKYIWIYNNGNRDAYIGPTGITTSTGFPVPPGAIFDARIGDAVDIFMIADAAGQDVRTLQAS